MVLSPLQINLPKHSFARRVEYSHCATFFGSTRPVFGSLPVWGFGQGLTVRVLYVPGGVVSQWKLALLQGVPTPNISAIHVVDAARLAQEGKFTLFVGASSSPTASPPRQASLWRCISEDNDDHTAQSRADFVLACT